MKAVIFLAGVLGSVLATPQSPDKDAVVLRFDNDNIGVDGYNFAFETSNGIKQEESARITNAGLENEAIAVQGSYSYTGPEGVVYSVTYTADENGFQPQGDHIPKV